MEMGHNMMTKSPSLLLRCFNAFGSTLDSLMTMITSFLAFLSNTLLKLNKEIYFCRKFFLFII